MADEPASPDTMLRDLSGNILGSARAETDALLDQAFVETADYRALINTQDFNYVVGRRGTGKSALFGKLKSYFADHAGTLIVSTKPEEHHSLIIQQQLRGLNASYREMRAVARLAWKVHVLLWVLPHLTDHYKLANSPARDRLERHRSRNHGLLDDHSPLRVAGIIRDALTKSQDYGGVVAEIAARFEVARFDADVQAALADAKKTAAILIDGLDEGWIPSEEATAVLGGLAAAVADFDETRSGIHGTLFIRDNMFRALAHFDQDFSRHIEGNTLRLHWDEYSLFDLVVSRLRVILNAARGGNPERIWKQFVSPNLASRTGFDVCLHHTLYRPRDILVLINRAYVSGQRRGDSLLTAESIELAAREISHDRLDDLAKEYDQVLPGVRSFVNAFEGRPAFAAIGDVVQHLDEQISSGAYDEESDSDFAILGTGRQVLSALYGVGFIGFEDQSRRSFIFCHDGSGSEVDSAGDLQQTVVHPCYWKALELSADRDMADVVVEINDEFDAAEKDDLKDLRVRRLGQVLSELSSIPVGSDGAIAFEDWVLRSVKLLFAGKLSNPELHPAGDGVQRRDIVATNLAETGLWRRVREDWGGRQVVIEVKNYERLKPDDYRQVLSYTSGEYGRFGIIVHRGSAEGVGERDRDWLKALYHEHQRVVLTIPDVILRRAISKVRNVRYDYIEDQLSRRLDTFVRNYLSLKVTRYRESERKRKRKRKRR